MGTKQSRCKFDLKHRLRGILLFPKTEGGRERHSREGLMSSNTSSSLPWKEGCLWEQRLYRVKVVWIQTRFGWKGSTSLPKIFKDQKLIPDLSRATPAILIWLPEDLLPPMFPFQAEGYRHSPTSRVLPRRHFKTDALVPHDA